MEDVYSYTFVNETSGEELVVFAPNVFEAYEELKNMTPVPDLFELQTDTL